MRRHSVRLGMWLLGLLALPLFGYSVILLFRVPQAHALLNCTNQVVTPGAQEPHPLRPNPGQVCTPDIPQTSRIECGTDIVVVKTMDMPRGGPGCTPFTPTDYGKHIDCTRTVTVTDVPVQIGLQDLELPIAGVASNVAISDTISDALKMRNYTSWYSQGGTEQADEELLPAGDPAALDRALTYAGPEKKLIAEEVLDARKEELIGKAVSGTSYNQIIGYVDRATNTVIGRKDALAYFATNPTGTAIEKIRLTDMSAHINPPYDPTNPDAMKWYTLWRQVPWTQTVDLAGEVFSTIAHPANNNMQGVTNATLVFDPLLTVSDLRVAFPHLAEDDQLAQVLQSVFVPPDVPATTNYQLINDYTQNADFSDINRDAPWATQGCRPFETGETPWNPGDNLGSSTTIKGKFSFTKDVTYSFDWWTAAQLADLASRGISPNIPVEVEVSAALSMFSRTPKALDDLYDRLLNAPGAVFKALYPLDYTPNDRPAAAGLTNVNCGPNCEVWPANEQGRKPEMFFPHLGSILLDWHQKLQCMLDPLGRCGGGVGGDQFTTIQCTIPLAPGSCGSVNWNDNYFNAYEKAYNSDTNNSWTLVKEPWAQDLIDGTSSWTCPRFVAALWLEESGGSAVGTADLGCLNYFDASAGLHPALRSDHRGGPANFPSYAAFEAHYRPILEDQLQCLRSYVEAFRDDFRAFMCQYRGIAEDRDPNKPGRQCYIFMGSNFPKNLCEIGAEIDVGTPVPPP